MTPACPPPSRVSSPACIAIVRRSKPTMIKRCSRKAASNTGSLEMRCLPCIQSAMCTIGKPDSSRVHASTNRRDVLPSASRRITSQLLPGVVQKSLREKPSSRPAHISRYNRASQNDRLSGQSYSIRGTHPGLPKRRLDGRARRLHARQSSHENRFQETPLRASSPSDTGCSRWKPPGAAAEPAWKEARRHPPRGGMTEQPLPLLENRLQCRHRQAKKSVPVRTVKPETIRR